jgi:signal transduction histidine kinase
MSGKPARPAGGFRKAILAASLLFAVLLMPWWMLGNWYEGSLIRQERASVSTQTSAMASSLVFAVNQRLSLLQGLYAFTRTEWPAADFDYPFQVYSSDIYFKSNGISSLMVAPEGIARYVYPLFNARKLSGYDVINDPNSATRADVQRAIHSHEITLSQPGELPEGGLGLTAWKAVYRGPALWGLVSISLDLNTILKDAGLSKPSSGLTLSLRDGSGHPFYGDEALWQQDPVIQTINLPEGTWELGVLPTEGWQEPVSGQVLLFRGISLALLALLAGIAFMVVNRQEQQARVAVLEERQRLARDLHDSVAQVLYSIGLGANSALSALEHDPPRTRSVLEYIKRLAEGGQAEMRALIFELRPDSISTDGLVAALNRLAEVLQTRHQIEVTSRFSEEPDISGDAKEALYRVAQEAANNIIKHARAGKVEMVLEAIDGQLCFEVSDNGVGFDAENDYPGHLGLRSMRERAAKNNARLTIKSSPGGGTKVEYRITLEKGK